MKWVLLCMFAAVLMAQPRAAADPRDEHAAAWHTAREQLGLRDAFLLQSPQQELVAWVSLPPTWKRTRKDVPVLVVVEGAGSNFLGALRHFRELRGSKDAIIIAPCTFSNTNALNAASYPFYAPALLQAHAERGLERLVFDGEGLRALLQVLRERWGAAAKCGITGFSGGGMLTYWWLLQHSADVSFAVLACANFGGGGVQGAVAATDGGPRVQLLLGEKDGFNLEVFGQKPGIIGQTDAAEVVLRQLGFLNINRSMIPGAGHSSFAAEVWRMIP